MLEPFIFLYSVVIIFLLKEIIGNKCFILIGLLFFCCYHHMPKFEDCVIVKCTVHDRPTDIHYISSIFANNIKKIHISLYRKTKKKKISLEQESQL